MTETDTTFAHYPAEARAAAIYHCGVPADWAPISDRGGVSVWRVNGIAGPVALKVAERRAAPAGVVAREAAVLQRLQDPGYLLDVGAGDGAPWVLTRWWEGHSTWEALEPVRAGGGSRPLARVRLVEACLALSDLHKRGWVHGDVQPHHIIYTRVHGTRLIDFSWACTSGLEAPDTYLGGITHLTSPELAGEVEREERTSPAAPSPADDVYALAASFWWALTGDWPLDYHRAGHDEDKLSPSDVCRIIASQGLNLKEDRVWPELQELLGEVLMLSADKRPDAWTLAIEIRQLPV
ncbi:serine/threonine-protein kinase [Streptomyces niger]|uniref:hypothetical protein n=1 Tax=Streptomyces niger TaxID=66373 RepID=UPI0018FE70D1|nr:hypothetical protein [Streptomyces niger]